MHRQRIKASSKKESVVDEIERNFSIVMSASQSNVGSAAAMLSRSMEKTPSRSSTHFDSDGDTSLTRSTRKLRQDVRGGISPSPAPSPGPGGRLTSSAVAKSSSPRPGTMLSVLASGSRGGTGGGDDFFPPVSSPGGTAPGTALSNAGSSSSLGPVGTPGPFFQTPSAQASGNAGGMTPVMAMEMGGGGGLGGGGGAGGREADRRRRKLQYKDVDNRVSELELRLDNLMKENDSLKEKLKLRQESYLRRESRYEQKIEMLKAQLDQAVLSRSTFDEKMRALKVLNEQIQEGIKNLQGRTEKVVRDHEDNLTRAFRARIHDMEKELSEEKKQHLMGADEWIQKTKLLAKELEWTREEAIKLDSLNKQLIAENKSLKVQFRAQQDDRQFMAKQLALIKKENTSLKKENHRLEEQIVLLSDPATVAASAPLSSRLQMSHGASSSRRASESGGAFGATDFLGESTSFGDTSGNVLLNDSTLDDGIGGASAPGGSPGIDRQNKYIDTIRRLRKLLELERKNAKTARSSQLSLLSERTELEVFLRQCIEDVRQEIVQRQMDISQAMKRKRSVAPLSARGGGGGGGFGGSGYGGDGPGSTLRDLDEFSIVDRQHVLELLLSKERVLMLLVEKTFPSRVVGGGALGNMMAGMLAGMGGVGGVGGGGGVDIHGLDADDDGDVDHHNMHGHSGTDQHTGADTGSARGSQVLPLQQQFSSTLQHQGFGRRGSDSRASSSVSAASSARGESSRRSSRGDGSARLDDTDGGEGGAISGADEDGNDSDARGSDLSSLGDGEDDHNQRQMDFEGAQFGGGQGAGRLAVSADASMSRFGGGGASASTSSVKSTSRGGNSKASVSRLRTAPGGSSGTVSSAPTTGKAPGGNGIATSLSTGNSLSGTPRSSADRPFGYGDVSRGLSSRDSTSSAKLDDSYLDMLSAR